MLETRVAEGAYSEVWKARDRVGQVVAIKVYRTRDPAALRRFRHEAGLLSSIRHPNLVEVIDVGETADGEAFMVLNWIDGPTLEQVLRGSFDRHWMAAVEVGYAIASALDAAHRQQILHQDVKPSNILLPAGRFANARLIDFGALGELDRADDMLGNTTRAGLVVGTPEYMSPEQFTGAALSNRTDLYGLGLVLREMLNGPEKLDFAAIAYSRFLTDRKTAFDVSIPKALRDTIDAMLERAPERRPASAAAVMEALRPLMATEWRAAGPMLSNGMEPRPAIAAAKRPPTPVSSARAPRIVRIGLGLVGVSMLTLIVITRAWKIPAPLPSAAVAQGVGLMLAGCLVGMLVSRVIEDRRSDLERNVSQALTGSRDRANLSRTMIIAVDAIIEQTSKLDAHFLGATIVGMIQEYEGARDSSDKQQALVRASELLERLLEKTSPWYVRNSRWVVAGTALVGLVSGALKLAVDFQAALR